MRDLTNYFKKIKDDPYIIFMLGFATIILTGAIILNLPISSQNGKSVGFINALFTATSATCVTGLTVVNTAQHWTVFGKFIIILLIQMGGLGVMTMTAMISFFFGKRISLKTRIFIMEERNVDELQGVVRLTKYIVIYTFLVELAGAFLLSFAFIPDYGVTKGIAFSLFHSISAFCNAGFDLVGDSMVIYVDNPIITFTICSLIVIGGLGFFVFLDIKASKNFNRLTLHTKLVLIITGILLVGGTIVIFLLEYNNPGTLGNLTLSGKIQASVFQAVVPRTAGYYSLHLEELRVPTVFLTIILMFIGGSSASTAGGIKTTTAGVIAIAIFNYVRGKRDIEVFEKRITLETVMKAIAIIGLSAFIITIVAFILTISESITGFSFLDILFETTSAFGTVGSTRGLTPVLSGLGKALLSIVMYIGRVGPLTIAFAFMKERKNIGNYMYPEGKIIIG
ncbi:MAG: TrkH family potassium uptake protein [Tissierellia bacterium]|nr:TrkH family potassium uptake protein [Tissierellia bacterium]